jgi:hypothetical protein
MTLTEWRVICAWCQTILQDGDGPTSHGICKKCAERLLAELKAWTNRQARMTGEEG